MTYREALQKSRLYYWTALMHECDQSIPAMAKRAGIDRTSVYKALKKAGVPVRPVNHGNWGDLTH